MLLWFRGSVSKGSLELPGKYIRINWNILLFKNWGSSVLILIYCERENVQKKTFTKWINAQLSKENKGAVTDLFRDLCDGHLLLCLLELLYGKKYRREKGRLRVHQLGNVNNALKILKENKVKLVNISNDDIVDGNPKLTLGLIWSIILHWEVKAVLSDTSSDIQETHLENTVLNWCKDITQGYAKVDIKNFTSSWKDGLAFNAVIHRYRCDLFDYDSLLEISAIDRLQHAFLLAEAHFEVDPLLEAEDILAETPDKRSVLMYVTALYKVLKDKVPVEKDTQHSFTSQLAVNLRRDETDSPRKQSARESRNRFSLTLSLDGSLSNMSDIDIDSYQTHMTHVLAWLLEAESHLSQQKPLSDNVEEVKDQFHAHEEFMMDLTTNQNNVGNALQEGNRLIVESKVGEEEEEEVREQMTLLNNRWEALRVAAMDRQAMLHEVLMELQKKQLDDLETWLTKTEGRITKQAKMGPGLEDVKRQMEEHKELQGDLESQQKKVNSLSHMVVVVDEESSENATAELEEKLTSLGERWAQVCKWTTERFDSLQSLLISWQAFLQEKTTFGNWLTEKEAALTEMMLVAVTKREDTVARAKKLKNLEQDLEVQHKEFDRLNETAQTLATSLTNTNIDPSGLEPVQSTLDEYSQRWDNLVQQMEQLSKQVAKLLSEPEVVQAEVVPVESSPSLKRPNEDTPIRREFDGELGSLVTWMEDTKKKKVPTATLR